MNDYLTVQQFNLRADTFMTKEAFDMRASSFMTKEEFNRRVDSLVTKEEFNKRLDTFVTKEEFNRRADTFVTKLDLKEAVKVLSDDFRNHIFDAINYSLEEANRQYGSQVEDLTHKIKSVGEGVNLAFEKTERLTLENSDEHIKFNRRLSRLEIV